MRHLLLKVLLMLIVLNCSTSCFTTLAAISANPECFELEYKEVEDYSEKILLVKANFPELYKLWYDGNIIINKVYTYKQNKTGDERVGIKYRYR